MTVDLDGAIHCKNAGKVESGAGRSDDLSALVEDIHPDLGGVAQKPQPGSDNIKLAVSVRGDGQAVGVDEAQAQRTKNIIFNLLVDLAHWLGVAARGGEQSRAILGCAVIAICDLGDDCLLFPAGCVDDRLVVPVAHEAQEGHTQARCGIRGKADIPFGKVALQHLFDG